MNIMRRISKEYNEPFVDVVKGFAAMRFSKAETARTLGISRGYFYELLDRFKLHGYFFDISNQRKSERKVYYRKRHSDADLLAEVAKYETTTELKKHSKISQVTIWRRFGSYAEARKLTEVL